MTGFPQASALVMAAVERITGGYIFPDVAARAATVLRARLDEGAYDLPVGPELCERLSADLLEACSDKHLRLLWHESAEASRDEAGLSAALGERFRRENHGVRCVQQLSGNIGLIELTIVPPAAIAGGTLAAAMKLVEGTDALILDLRGTLGGAPDGAAFLCSYLFADGEVHLNDIIEGPDGPTRQFWTNSYLPGPRYLHRAVYVLTSPATFSGGEEIAYELQALGRATIVGETTGGGAHPSEVVSLAEHVELRLPVARAVNPVTGTNWETVGVQPDLYAQAETALTVAHALALKTLADRAVTAGHEMRGPSAGAH
jgi:hypothetical protein